MNAKFITILKEGKIYNVNKKDFLSLFYSKIIPKFYKRNDYPKELNDFSNSLCITESIQIYDDGVIRLNLHYIDYFKNCNNNHIVLYNEYICKSIIYSFMFLYNN